MGTANLALVFGPTLTLAPADIDPRRLHNDVPAVNVLIQTCLEHHEFLFQFDQAKSPEDLPSPNNKSKSPDAFTMSPCKSPIVSEPLPHTHSPIQSSPMVHTPTPPPASEESEAEPMPKEEGQRDEGNEAKDRTEGEEEEEEEEEDDDTDLDTDEGERIVCLFCS